MEDFIYVAQGLKLVWVIAALTFVFAWVRFLDYRAGLDFKEFFNDLKTDPQAAALYLSGRYVGTCLLVGWLLS